MPPVDERESGGAVGGGQYTIAELMQGFDGVEPERIIVFDDKDGLGADRPALRARLIRYFVTTFLPKWRGK